MNRWTLILTVVFTSTIAVIAQGPVVFQGGVVNGASFSLDQPDKRVSPGSLISVFGSNLSASIALADTIPISVTVSDVESVTFNGVPAPILSAGPGQINVQLPWEELPPVNGTTKVQVVVTRTTAGSSQPVQTPIGQYSPGIFTALANGAGQGLALIFPDNAIAGPVNSVQGRLTHPAKPGDILQIYATGLGPVIHTPPDGQNAPTAPQTTVLPVVMIGGVPAQVQFSGLSPQFVGLYQVNAQVPQNAPTGVVPLQIQIGGVTSSPQVTIAIAAQ